MSDAKKGDKATVIKKIKKGGHAGAHGGSWKVAYADFVTAMMAFFLLLWLLAMVSPEKRIVMAEYFKEFNIFKAGSSSVLSGAPAVMQKPGGETHKDMAKGATTRDMTMEDISTKIQAQMGARFEKLKNQIVLDVFEGGIRIQIVDKEGNPMFEPGSAVLTERAKEVLGLISENIKETTNRIAVEGHTDSTPYSANGISNWEISTMRASAARKELQADGIDPYRIARVVGYADTEPYIKENPKDARNRRISLILLYEKKKNEENSQTRVPELGTSDITLPTPAPSPVPAQ
ncbi:MAG: OmpA family protein [Nitrospinae bacterium]|nr:OmpA family protein [Nitrospinota bacterium]